MRTLSTQDGYNVIKDRNRSIVGVPTGVRGEVFASRLDDGDVFVLVLREDRYMYEWYKRGEL